MKIQKVFAEFLSILHSKFPDVFRESVIDSDYEGFQTTFFEDIPYLFQRKESLFEKERLIFDGDLSSVWGQLDEETKKTVWSRLQRCSVHSVFHGDINENIEGIMGMLKPLFKMSGNYTDEIDSILGKEESKSKFVDILEYVKESNILSVFISIFEDVDFSNINLEQEADIEGLANNKEVIELQEKLKQIFAAKMQSGEISQAAITKDIQTIMVKLQAIFGESMNDMLGTRKGPAPEIALSNTPEARKARMIARLQRKLAEKK